MKKILCSVLACFILLNFISVKALNISASSAIVINGHNGEVLYSHNADVRMSMASTTKIMTALLLCEHGDLDREVKITEKMVAVEGSSMGLLPGDTVSLRGLLYGMMLPSGNDAATATAIILAGSVEKFAEMMNQRAEMLGLKDTHFVTPSGLDADEHYTTARELALITKEALKNKDFAAAVGSEYETLYYGNPPYRRTLKNHNKLLGTYDGLIGVKTGFTKKSGRCLVTAAKRDNEYVIAVTLNASDDWNDHKALLDYGFDCLQTIELSDDTEYILYSSNANMNDITLRAETVVLSTETGEGITKKVYLPKFFYGQIKKGDKIGEIHYFKGNELQIKANVFAVNESNYVKVDFFAELKNTFFYILSCI